MKKRAAPRNWKPVRRLLLAGLALCLLLLANLRPVYRVTVSGETLPGSFTLRQIESSATLARNTAEEILEDEVKAPRMHRQLRLSLGRADGDGEALTDALLRSTRGITVSEQVLVNGVALGTVEDGFRLCRELRRSIAYQMPMAAVSGHISGNLELRRIYTRAGSDTPYKDMVLLITGMAPVVYVDEEGKLA